MAVTLLAVGAMTVVMGAPSLPLDEEQYATFVADGEEPLAGQGGVGGSDNSDTTALPTPAIKTEPVPETRRATLSVGAPDVEVVRRRGGGSDMCVGKEVPGLPSPRQNTFKVMCGPDAPQEVSDINALPDCHRRCWCIALTFFVRWTSSCSFSFFFCARF